MKKIALSLFCLFCFGSIFAQSGKLRVAISFDTDTTFTLLGPLSTKSLEINLTNILYKQIEMLVDTNAFQLVPVAFPEDLSSTNNPAITGIPKVNQLKSWATKLQKKDGCDLLLIVYKPIQTNGTNTNLCGFSYGLSTGRGIVFSLNNALVFNLKTMELLAATSIDSESDYMAGFFVLDKNLPSNHADNIEMPVQMINKLNQDFALKVFQCLQTSKKRFTLK
jgi:hypothetical protein